MRCFVINLDSEPARREDIVDHLLARGIEHEVFRAVDGRKLSSAELARHYDPIAARRVKREMTVGEIGCALSHLGVYRRMIEQSLPYALVLEDDACLDDHVVAVLESLEPLLHDQAPQVVLLNCAKWTSYLASIPLIGHHVLAPVLDGAWGAYGYVLNRAAAESLLGNLYPIRLPADMWDRFRHEKWIRMRAVVPYCIGLSSLAEQSSLRGQRAPEEAQERRRAEASWLYWLRRYGYEKFIYQIVVRPFIRRQQMTW